MHSWGQSSGATHKTCRSSAWPRSAANDLADAPGRARQALVVLAVCLLRLAEQWSHAVRGWPWGRSAWRSSPSRDKASDRRSCELLVASGDGVSRRSGDVLRRRRIGVAGRE